MLENVPQHDRVKRLVRHRLERFRSLEHRYPRFSGHPARELGVPFKSRGLPSEVPEDGEEVPGRSGAPYPNAQAKTSRFTRSFHRSNTPWAGLNIRKFSLASSAYGP